MMQCGTSRVPMIRCERNFRRYAEMQMADEFAGCDKVVAHPSPSECKIESVKCKMGEGNRFVFAIGPEGGWTEDEVAMIESKGFIRRSLGSRILRTDTATLALIAQFMGKD